MKQSSENNYFCVLPFIGTCIEAGGRHKPCCKYKGWSRDGDAREIELKDLTKIPFYDNIRKDMLENKKHEACLRCWEDEEFGVESMRQQSNEQFGHLYNEEVKVQVVDFGFGNMCNAACVMCESSSSMMWSKFDRELEAIKGNPFSRWTVEKTVDSFNWTNSDINNIECIIHAQNEVFVSKDFINFLDRVERVADISSKSILVSTNASIWPDEAVLKRLSQFKKCHIQISVDGVGSVNDYIRYPLKWKTVSTITKKWIDFSNEHKIKVTGRCTVSIYNIFHLLEVKEWWSEVAEGRRIKFGHSWFPEYVSPLVYRDILIPLIADQVEEIPELERLIGTDRDYSDQKSLFWQFTEKMDQFHNTDFHAQFPRLSRLLKSNNELRHG